MDELCFGFVSDLWLEQPYSEKASSLRFKACVPLLVNTQKVCYWSAVLILEMEIPLFACFKKKTFLKVHSALIDTVYMKS